MNRNWLRRTAEASEASPGLRLQERSSSADRVIGTGMMNPRYPSLFEINTRAWLFRLSQEAGKPVTLADCR